MKDKHGDWQGPGYYRTNYGKDMPGKPPTTVYWISDNDTRNGKGMWVLGTEYWPWEPVKVIARPRKATGPYLDLKR